MELKQINPIDDFIQLEVVYHGQFGILLRLHVVGRKRPVTSCVHIRDRQLIGETNT